jgi:hypothetical protein
MKRKQKLVSDRVVEELIKQATESAARDLGISTREISARSRKNLCSAAKLAYDKVKNTFEAVRATGGGSDNEFTDLIMAGVTMHTFCDPD